MTTAITPEQDREMTTLLQRLDGNTADAYRRELLVAMPDCTVVCEGENAWSPRYLTADREAILSSTAAVCIAVLRRIVERQTDYPTTV